MQTLNVEMLPTLGNTPENVLDVELMLLPTDTTEAIARRKAIYETMQECHSVSIPNKLSVCDKINAIRYAKFKGFFRPEDKYIPDNEQENFHTLELTTCLDEHAPLPKAYSIPTNEDSQETTNASLMPA